MKKSNVIIFVVVILVIIVIFGYAIWDANKSLNEINEGKTVLIGENEIDRNTIDKNVINENIVNQNTINQNEVKVESTIQDKIDYTGTWYISEESYLHSERIDSIMDKREENLISNEEFEKEMKEESNSNIVELDIDEHYNGKIKFDFTLTSPAPTQREGKLDDIVVEMSNGVGTFNYIDNWGTSGKGTIMLGENQIELRLETTKAAQGAQWGVEGVYTFSYKRID